MAARGLVPGGHSCFEPGRSSGLFFVPGRPVFVPCSSPECSMTITFNIRTAATLSLCLFGLVLAARSASPPAFGRHCIPPGCVTPPSNIPDILGRRALPGGRIAALGATPDLHHGLLFTNGQGHDVGSIATERARGRAGSAARGLLRCTLETGPPADEDGAAARHRRRCPDR